MFLWMYCGKLLSMIKIYGLMYLASFMIITKLVEKSLSNLYNTDDIRKYNE